MPNKNLIYIGVPGSSVFQSQVIELLKEISEGSYFNKIILLIGVNNFEEFKEDIFGLKKSGVEVIPFIKYPNYNFYFNKQVKELVNALLPVLSENTILHLRGEAFAAAIKKSVERLNYSKVKILADIRGASYEETQIYNKLKPFLFQLKLYQHRKNLKFLNLNTDSVSCVSQALKEYVLSRSEIEDTKAYVNPCVAGNDFHYSRTIRTKYRKKLNLTDKDILFLFVTGGNKKWQNTNKIINEIVDRGYKVLNLSKSEIKHKNVINLFVSYSEVPCYLSAADISIIWRNTDVVNHVASPVKFSEYVCSGLPVIANEGVDAINRYIDTTGYGVTVKNLNNLNSNIVKKLISLDREKISKYALQHFGIKKISSDYVSIYKKLLN